MVGVWDGMRWDGSHRFQCKLNSSHQNPTNYNIWSYRTKVPVNDGPKLRVLTIVKWEWNEMAKNRAEPQKITHSSETEFFQVGPNGKIVAPGTLVICPVDKNHNSETEK